MATARQKAVGIHWLNVNNNVQDVKDNGPKGTQTSVFEEVWENDVKTVAFVQKARTCEWACETDDQCNTVKVTGMFCKTKLTGRNKCMPLLADGKWAGFGNSALCASGSSGLGFCQCLLPNDCPAEALCVMGNGFSNNFCAECSADKACPNTETMLCSDRMCILKDGQPPAGKCTKDSQCEDPKTCLPTTGVCAGTNTGGLGSECKNTANCNLLRGML